jgi:5-methylcytosine-specific restriction endonuclease McrA
MNAVIERRPCLREPIPEIERAAILMNEAAEAHLAGNRQRAAELLLASNLPAVRAWGESLWGKNSPYIPMRKKMGPPATLPKEARTGRRNASPELKTALIARDGHRCRFCGIPVIRPEVRDRVRKLYPEVPLWGRFNWEQHAGFQTLWLQYDHIIPHSRGGTTDLDNMVITCGPCNFGRMEYTLEEVGLLDPRDRSPVASNWDGLERFR